MSALVLVIFFGLSTGVIGKIKGSSFFVWFMIGFVLPGIGTVVAILYRNERAEPNRRCEECGNVVALHQQVCRRCGRDLYFPEPEPQQRLFEA
jgi:ribosomal protein S27AE